MSANPLLKKLGFSDTDRVVIFHADDIGMCHAANAAYEDLLQVGSISSAAVMVPCPWFAATAQYCRKNQAELDHLDMGVHLTLTNEWSNYRWGPLSTQDRDSGLLDADGYFFGDCEPVQEWGLETAVYQELAAQFDRAVVAGIVPTHIDSHMGCVFHPRLMAAYLQLAQERQVPALMLRANWLVEAEMDAHDFAVYHKLLSDLEATGFPVLDSLHMLSLDQPQQRLAQAKKEIDSLPAGVSYFIIHPSKDTPELRAIAPDWACRVADYELFMSAEWQAAVAQSGVKVIGWQAIKETMQ